MQQDLFQKICSIKRRPNLPCEAGDVCARAWGGMSVEFNWGWIDSSESKQRQVTRLTAHKVKVIMRSNKGKGKEVKTKMKRWGAKLTNGTEVEEERQFSSAGQAGVGLAQFIEEGVCTCLQRWEPGHGCVFQQSRAEGDGLWWGTGFKHLMGQREQTL